MQDNKTITTLVLIAILGLQTNCDSASEEDLNSLALESDVTEINEDTSSISEENQEPHEAETTPRISYISFVQEFGGGNDYAINAHYQYSGGNVNMWAHSSYDKEQDFYWWYNDKLRVRGKNLCLNAHNHKNGGNVNLFTCSATDPDQKWWPEKYTRYGESFYLIKLKGTNYCLNANNVYNGSNLNLWTCDSSDWDQLFAVKY